MSVLKKFMLIFLNNVYVFFIFIVSEFDWIKGNKYKKIWDCMFVLYIIWNLWEVWSIVLVINFKIIIFMLCKWYYFNLCMLLKVVIVMYFKNIEKKNKRFRG